MRATASKKRFAMVKTCRQAFRADLTDGSDLLSFQMADGQRVRSLLEGAAHLVRKLLVF